MKEKLKKIYDDYKLDCDVNGVSGNDRASKCKWYVLVDSYTYERANVMKHVYRSTIDKDQSVGHLDAGGANGENVQTNGAEMFAQSMSKLVRIRGEKLAIQEDIQDLS